MNAPTSTDSSRHDDLPLPYRIAVQTILDEPMPKVDLTHLVPDRSAVNIVKHSRRRWMTRVCGLSLAGVAAAVLVISLFAIRPGDAWAQVAKAVRQQGWVRMRATAQDQSAHVEMWLSPTKRIGAGRSPGAAIFVEFDQFKLQRFDEKERTILISEPGPSDLDHFVDLDSVLESFETGKMLRQSKAESLKLLGQSSKKGRAGDDRWTDYILDYEDARRSPPLFRRVFRVPEGVKLPTRMTEEWTFQGKSGFRSYEMDYPASGPVDLFALDVPKDAKVVDTRSGEELKSLLAAYTRQQSAAFDPYSATVLSTSQDWKSIAEAFHVRLDASGHTAEVVDREQLLKFMVEGELRIPEDGDRLQWWKTEVDKMAFHPFGKRDTFHPGQSFCPDLAGYPLLGIPNEGVRATLNTKPFIGPPDSVMVTVENSKTGNTLRRYWLAPDRQFLCVRCEISSDRLTDWIDTTIVDAAEKSPKGCWYPTQLRRGQVERSGDELHAVAGVAPVLTQVYRFVIKFE